MFTYVAFVGDNHHRGHPTLLPVAQETPDFVDFSLAGLGSPAPLTWEVSAQVHPHKQNGHALWLVLSDVPTFVTPLVPLNPRNGRGT